MRRFRKCSAVATGTALLLLSTVAATAFSIGFGAPIEERYGSEYGAEYAYRNGGYYHRGPARLGESSRHATRCAVRRVETPRGVRRAKICK